MSLPLLNSPADIVTNYLLALSTNAGFPSGWTIATAIETSTPDNLVTITDVSGKYDGRDMTSGEVNRHWGVEIRVRSIHFSMGYNMAQYLRAILSTATKDVAVVCQNTTAVYNISALSRLQIQMLGRDRPRSERFLQTLTGLISLERIS